MARWSRYAVAVPRLRRPPSARPTHATTLPCLRVTAVEQQSNAPQSVGDARAHAAWTRRLAGECGYITAQMYMHMECVMCLLEDRASYQGT